MVRKVNRPVALMAVLLVAVAGYMLWQVSFPRGTAHYAVVVDRSPSPAFSVCNVVVGAARRELSEPQTTRESRLTLVATGDARNDFQGQLIKQVALPKKVAVIHSQKKQRLREQAFIDDLAEICNGLPKANRSPVLNAVAAAVNGLRSQGCRAGAGCRVEVASDGQENVDAALAAALKGDERAAKALAPRIDNAGITVAFCGLAQAPEAQRAKPARDDGDHVGRARRVWSTVFTDPSLVSAAPFCDGVATSSTAAR